MINPTQIAVVDDDDSVRESLQGLVRSLGFAAEIFASAEDFLQSANLRRTQTLILDVRMPGMNGLELQCRLLEMRCAIPIIFITAHETAHEDEKARSRAFENGAVDYLLKPFSEDALIKAIRAAFNSQTSECLV